MLTPELSRETGGLIPRLVNATQSIISHLNIVNYCTIIENLPDPPTINSCSKPLYANLITFETIPG